MKIFLVRFLFTIPLLISFSAFADPEVKMKSKDISAQAEDILEILQPGEAPSKRRGSSNTESGYKSSSGFTVDRFSNTTFVPKSKKSEDVSTDTNKGSQ